MVFDSRTEANRLISEVFKRPALWNQRHPSYHNRHLTDRIWMNIATIMKHPKQVLKVKWKGLRDTFRGELRKQEFYEKNKLPRPLWTHYNSLQFLAGQMLPKPPSWEGKRSRKRKKDFEPADKDCVDVDSQSPSRSEGSSTNGIASPGNGADFDPIGNSTDKQEKRNDRRQFAQLHFEACDVLEVVDMLSAGLISGKTDPIQIDLRSSPAEDPTENRRKKSPNPQSSNGRHFVDRQKQDERQQQKKRKQASDVIKEEEIVNYEIVNLRSVGENLDENEPMIQALPEQVLVEETADTCEVPNSAVDPLGGGSHCDDNYYFFMSLLPHVRSLPVDRQMLLRMQMHNLVYQEVYKKNSSALRAADPIDVQERINPSTSSAVAPGDNRRRPRLSAAAWSSSTFGVDKRP